MIAVILASIAAMLVIMAGKSCAESISKSNGGKSSKTPISPQYQAVYPTEAKKKTQNSTIPYEEDVPQEEIPEYIPVTEIFTDENGETYIAVVSEDIPEPTTKPKSALNSAAIITEKNKKAKTHTKTQLSRLIFR